MSLVVTFTVLHHFIFSHFWSVGILMIRLTTSLLYDTDHVRYDNLLVCMISWLFTWYHDSFRKVSCLYITKLCFHHKISSLGDMMYYFKVWSIFCKCRHRKEEIEDPSTISRPPTQFSSKSVALTVVKQESRDSILSNKNNVHMNSDTQVPVVLSAEGQTQTIGLDSKRLWVFIWLT